MSVQFTFSLLTGWEFLVSRKANPLHSWTTTVQWSVLWLSLQALELLQNTPICLPVGQRTKESVCGDYTDCHMRAVMCCISPFSLCCISDAWPYFLFIRKAAYLEQDVCVLPSAHTTPVTSVFCVCMMIAYLVLTLHCLKIETGLHTDHCINNEGDRSSVKYR